MSNELRPYSEYKKSPFQWLDSIPIHWEIKRAKAVYKKANRPVKEGYEVITCFRDGVVTLRKNRRTTGFTESVKEIGYQGIKKGDLVIHVMDAFAGAVGVSDSEGKSTPVYSVCIPKEDLNNHYYAYIVREMAKTGFIQSLYRGIRERSSDFRFEVFANQYLPIPLREEQDQIVKYLDYKLAKINRFIKAKKKLIAVLREQIECYLFGNQNKSTSYEINSWGTAFPIDWLFIKASRLTEEVNIKNNVGSELLAVTQDRGVVYKKDCEQNYVSPSGDTSNLKLVRNGDYVISLRSFQGGIEFSEIEGIVSPAYNVFCLRKEYSSYEYKMYYKYLFKSKIFISVLNTLVSGIRDGKNINYSDFSNVLLPVPPKKTAKMVCNLIEPYENIKKRFENEVILLNEFKASLISDVVTGKIDVRNIKIEELQNEEIELEETDEEIIEGEEDIEIKESGE